MTREALADLDRSATAARARMSAVLSASNTRWLLKAAERRSTRTALKYVTTPPTIKARGTGAFPATPRFQANSVTKARIEQIDSAVRAAAIRHKLDGISLEDLGVMFGLKPRSIEAMLRRNADLHTLRIYQKRVKLSMQDTLYLIDRQRRATTTKGTA